MNKYEKHLLKAMGPTQYVKDWLFVHRAWCHVDELITNPAIFPEQTWPLSERLNWALNCKLEGLAWILSGPPQHSGCDFSIMSSKTVPHMKYRHISKVWRLAHESV